jgi:hypothetical protein
MILATGRAQGIETRPPLAMLISAADVANMQVY